MVKDTNSSKKDVLETEGVIKACLPNASFRVEVDDERFPKGTVVLCHISGKMRKHYIKILPGDRVKIEISLYDLTKGRIMFRFK